MIPNEAIACTVPSTSGATAPAALHLFVCEMQLWLFQWKNMLKVSFCSRKKEREKEKIPPKWRREKRNVYGVFQNTYQSLDLHSRLYSLFISGVPLSTRVIIKASPTE